MPIGYLLTGGLGSYGSGATGIDTPSLSIEDDGTGTSATATVSGSSPGTTNTVSAFSIDYETGLMSEVTSSSRSDDGTVSLSLSPGMYLGLAVSVLGVQFAASSPYSFWVTSVQDAVQKQSLDSIVTRIRSLGLSGLDQSEIVARKVPYDNNRVFPGVTVSWTEEQEASAVNQRDDHGYPFLITLATGQSRGLTDHVGKIALWRQKIFRAFNRKRLSGVTSTGSHQLECTVQRKSVTIPQRYIANQDVGQMVVTAWFREPRDN